MTVQTSIFEDEIRFEDHPNTRDDTGVEAIQNVLYTDPTGDVLSAPIQSLGAAVGALAHYTFSRSGSSPMAPGAYLRPDSHPGDESNIIPHVAIGSKSVVGLSISVRDDLTDAIVEFYLNSVLAYTWTVNGFRTAHENFTLAAPAFTMTAGQQLDAVIIDPGTAMPPYHPFVRVYWTLTSALVAGQVVQPVRL